MIRLSPLILFLYILETLTLFYTLGLYEARQRLYLMCMWWWRCDLFTNFEHTHVKRNVTAVLDVTTRPMKSCDVCVVTDLYFWFSWKILSDPSLIIAPFIIVLVFAGIFAAYLHKLRPIWSSLSNDEPSCISFTEALSRSALKVLPRFVVVPKSGLSKSATTAFHKWL